LVVKVVVLVASWIIEKGIGRSIVLVSIIVLLVIVPSYEGLVGV